MKDKKCLSFSGMPRFMLLPDDFIISDDISDLSNWKQDTKNKTMKTKKHKVEIEDAWMDHVRILENGLSAAKTDLSFERVRLGYMDNDVLIENQKHDIAIMEDNISDTKKMIDGIIKANTKPIKKDLPKTWEEYFFNAKSVPTWLLDINVPEQYKALCKLEILRDVYNDGWAPDWRNSVEKCVIYLYMGEITQSMFTGCDTILSFKTEKLRNKFATNFSDLIEQAKPLL